MVPLGPYASMLAYAIAAALKRRAAEAADRAGDVARACSGWPLTPLDPESSVP